MSMGSFHFYILASVNCRWEVHFTISYSYGIIRPPIKENTMDKSYLRALVTFAQSASRRIVQNSYQIGMVRVTEQDIRDALSQCLEGFYRYDKESAVVATVAIGPSLLHTVLLFKAVKWCGQAWEFNSSEYTGDLEYLKKTAFLRRKLAELAKRAFIDAGESASPHVAAAYLGGTYYNIQERIQTATRPQLLAATESLRMYSHWGESRRT